MPPRSRDINVSEFPQAVCLVPGGRWLLVADKKRVQYLDLESPNPSQHDLIDIHSGWSSHYIRAMTLSWDEQSANFEFALLLALYPDGKCALLELFVS